LDVEVLPECGGVLLSSLDRGVSQRLRPGCSVRHGKSLSSLRPGPLNQAGAAFWRSPIVVARHGGADVSLPRRVQRCTLSSQPCSGHGQCRSRGGTIEVALPCPRMLSHPQVGIADSWIRSEALRTDTQTLAATVFASHDRYLRAEPPFRSGNPHSVFFFRSWCPLKCMR